MKSSQLGKIFWKHKQAKEDTFGGILHIGAKRGTGSTQTLLPSTTEK